MVYFTEEKAVALATIIHDGGNAGETRLEKTQLVPNTTILKLKAVLFGVSADKKFVYLAHDTFKNYRYSFWAKYSIYEVATG